MLRNWFYQRLPAQDTTTLSQRNIYILPTRSGWMFGLTVVVLLLASINYQLNLGYALTFLVAGSVGVSMLFCHGTLRGIAMSLSAPAAVFIGTHQPIRIELRNPTRRPRIAVAIGVLDTSAPSYLTLTAQSQTALDIPFAPEQRGWQKLPMLSAYTQFPLGAFRAWTVWKPASQVLVYPRPEPDAPDLPLTASHHARALDADDADEASANPTSSSATAQDADPTDVRPYRRGDPQKWILWKKVAQNDQWVSREMDATPPPSSDTTVWLEWQQALSGCGIDLAGSGYPSVNERALGRLCAWVLQAQEQGLRYGLLLPGTRIAPDNGAAHQSACLRALALA